MKKSFYLIPILGIMLACSENTEQKEKLTEEAVQEQTEKSPEERLQAQAEAIEKNIQNLDDTIRSSDIEMKKTQKELDSLLKGI